MSWCVRVAHGMDVAWCKDDTWVSDVIVGAVDPKKEREIGGGMVFGVARPACTYAPHP